MPDSRVLGKIILLQSTLHALNTEKAIADFVCRGLSTVPGIENVSIFLKDRQFNDFNNLSENLKDLQNQGRFDLNDEIFFNEYLETLQKKPFIEYLKIRSILKNYGYLYIKYNDKKKYYSYKAYLENTMNLVALLLENNEQKDHLMQTQIYLEKTVKERTLELEKALNDKNILIQDIHHRVKNNLSQIYSLVALEYDNFVFHKNKKDPKFILEGLKNRIMVISNLYSQLYTPRNNYDKISAKDYFSSILKLITQAYSEEKFYELNLDIDDIIIPLKNNIHLGLIVNEIFSNIHKHAFTQKNSIINQVVVSFKKNGDKNILVVKDNGCGYNGDIKEIKKESLGIQLVEIFTQQLGGELSLDSRNGFEYRIIF
ncbi:MAG: sensor histidine kinase [Spirochaetales bacterium]|nr:sensor histidine kinase [Spirochaetales bacterium]